MNYIIKFFFYILHFTFYILHFTFYILHFTFLHFLHDHFNCTVGYSKLTCNFGEYEAGSAGGYIFRDESALCRSGAGVKTRAQS